MTAHSVASNTWRDAAKNQRCHESGAAQGAIDRNRTLYIKPALFLAANTVLLQGQNPDAGSRQCKSPRKKPNLLREIRLIFSAKADSAYTFCY
nr:hypothetical protein [Comamonas koreensis]